ncbi:MAG: 6-bladed beta-propeller [Planctomycetota bacterium]|nr:MAG: 6-bladed beta-propeller [Planctomycetota bacterium]
MSSKFLKMGFLCLMLFVIPLVGCNKSGGGSAAVPQGLQMSSAVQAAWPNNGIDPNRLQFVNIVSPNESWVQAESNVLYYSPKAVAVDNGNNLLYTVHSRYITVTNLSTGVMKNFVIAEGGAGIDVSATGEVYVAFPLQKKILVYNSDGTLARTLDGAGRFVNPNDVLIDKNLNRLYVCDSKKPEVSAWTLDGQFLFSFENSQSAPLGAPLQAAINSQGNIYVLQWGSQYVLIYDSNGKFIRSFGTQGTRSGQFVHPKGIAIDSDDNVYIVDNMTCTLQIFNSQDKLCLWINEGQGFDPGQLRGPGMLAFDSHDRLFIPEYANNRTQVLQYLKVNQ